MTHSTEESTLKVLSNEQRFEYFINTAVQQQEIWILTDHDGCVMLNTEDEDCIPVWPSLESAEEWATGEWAECEAEAISLKNWQLRWTEGLESDDFYIIVHPIEQEEQEGIVIHPAHLDKELRKAIKLKNKTK